MDDFNLDKWKADLATIPNMADLPESPRPLRQCWLVSMDIGLMIDYTAIAVVLLQYDTKRKEYLYHLTNLIQVTNIGGPDVVDAVDTVMKKLIDLKLGTPYFIYDSSGLGNSLADYFNKIPCLKYGASARQFPINFTGSEGWRRDPKTGKYNVGVTQMISAFLVIQQFHRFDYPKQFELLLELRKQVSAFEQSQSPQGHLSFGAASGHDDLIMALSMSAWVGEKAVKTNEMDILTGAEANWRFPVGYGPRDHWPIEY